MATRIGPKMLAVVNYVREHNGCVMIRCAERVGPNGSLRYGYAAIHRAIDAGLIVALPGEGNRQTLHLAPCTEHDDCAAHPELGMACADDAA